MGAKQQQELRAEANAPQEHKLLPVTLLSGFLGLYLPRGGVWASFPAYLGEVMPSANSKLLAPGNSSFRRTNA